MRIILLLIVLYSAACVLLYFARNWIMFPLRGGLVGTKPSIPGAEFWTTAADDGTQITLTVFPPAPNTQHPAPVLIWFHGNAETVAGIAPIIREFHPDGVSVVAVEYRGYAGSRGKATVDSAERDALAVWNWITSRQDLDSSRVIVYGRSIGTGPAIRLASAKPVAGLIVESAFTSLRALARVHYAIFPTFLAGTGFDNLARIATVRCPILFIHGDRDRIIPIRMGQALAERAGNRAELYVINGSDHNETYAVGGEKYVERVKQFVALNSRRNRLSP